MGDRNKGCRNLRGRSGFSEGEGVRRGPLVFSLAAVFLILTTSQTVFALDCASLLSPIKRQKQDVARIRVQPVVQVKDQNGNLREEASGYPSLCTGFAVQTKRGGKHFVTAGHCLPQSIKKENEDIGARVDKVYFVLDDGFVAKREQESSVQEGYVSEISQHRLEGFDGVDIGYFRPRLSEIPTTNILKLASRPPSFGEKLYAIGYPGGYGPVRFECRYVGVGLRVNGSFQDMIAIDELDCPAISKQPDDIGGMSGGAIVNRYNEVVGVVVQQIQAEIGSVMAGSSERMSRVGMVRLSEKNTRGKGLYRPTQYRGEFTSRYLDWTSGNEVKMKYRLKDGSLHGPAVIKTLDGAVLEEYDFNRGNWAL